MSSNDSFGNQKDRKKNKVSELEDENAKKVRIQEVYNKTLEELESTEASKNPQNWYKKNINNYHFMLVFGIIFLLIGLIGYFVISGTQAGWCNQDGEGSGCFVQWITSNQGGDGTLNTTTEVVAEFFAIMFIIVGVFLTVYSVAHTNISNTLLNYKQYQALLLLNKSKYSDDDAISEAECADLAQKMKDDPPTFLKLLSMNVNNNLSYKKSKKQIARDNITELQFDSKIKELKKQKALKKELLNNLDDDSDSDSVSSNSSLLN